MPLLPEPLIDPQWRASNESVRIGRAHAHTAAINSAIQRASPDGILLVDPQGHLISHNERFAEIWRLSPQELAGQSDSALLGNITAQLADPNAFLARTQQLYARTEETSRDTIRLKDGRTLDRYSGPVRSDDGTYLGRVWFFRDITELKRADDKIREDASQFHALVEQQVAGIFIIGSDGNVAYINPRFSALFGYTPPEVVGRPFTDVVVEGDRDALRRNFAVHLQGGPPATQTATAIKRKDGGVMHVLAHASLSSFEGKPALVGIIVDVTEERRATDLLRASEERFRNAFNAVNDAIGVCDIATARIIEANPRACEMFGYSRAELLELELGALCSDAAPYTRADLAPLIQRAIAGAPLLFEWHCKSKDGHEFWTEASLRQAQFGGRAVLFTTAQDITKRKAALEALVKRDRISHAVALGVAKLVSASALEVTMPATLEIVARALDVERIMMLKRTSAETGGAGWTLAYTWQSEARPTVDPAILSVILLKSPEFLALQALLSAGQPVIVQLDAATGTVAQVMRDLHILSTLMLPIFVAGEYWGAIGVDACKVRRSWETAEMDALVTLAEVIGTVLMREQTELTLRNSEERFRAVSDTAQDAIIMVDSGARVVYWNRAAERVLGYSAAEAIGKHPHEWLAPKRFHDKATAGMSAFAATGNGDFVGKTVELAARRKDGVEIPVEISITSMRLGDQWHAVAMLRDITQRKRADEQISHMARYDTLTGLANRVSFVESLQESIARARHGGARFALIYLDLDHFKDINDTLGHPIGDLLLQSVADRLRNDIGITDILARFSGDEFALISTGSPESVNAADLANLVLKSLGRPFLIQDNDIRTGASLGIARYGPDSADAETLLSQADVALYRAKLDGRGTFRFFTKAMDLEVQTRVRLTTELRKALAARQLFLVYQPQVDAESGRIVGVEALARWRKPNGQVIPPSLFIPVAEKSGLIIAIGQWALQEACRQMRLWLDAGIAPPLIAVNVSGLQFKNPLEFEGNLAAILKETAVPAQRIELELTETVLMDISREHNDALLRLRKEGHRIAIDDFGTGYSSLEYLGRFPVDRIKIAQNFVLESMAAPSNTTIAKAAVGLAHDLNLDVVVEGVETAEQLKRVRSWGCRYIQGFYFSKPLPADGVTSLLRAGAIVRAGPISDESAANSHS